MASTRYPPHSQLTKPYQPWTEKNTLWPDAGVDQNFQKNLEAICPYGFQEKSVWTNPSVPCCQGKSAWRRKFAVKSFPRDRHWSVDGSSQLDFVRNVAVFGGCSSDSRDYKDEIAQKPPLSDPHPHPPKIYEIYFLYVLLRRSRFTKFWSFWALFLCLLGEPKKWPDLVNFLGGGPTSAETLLTCDSVWLTPYTWPGPRQPGQNAPWPISWRKGSHQEVPWVAKGQRVMAKCEQHPIRWLHTSTLQKQKPLPWQPIPP